MRKVFLVFTMIALVMIALPVYGQPKTTGRITTVYAADGTNLTAQVEKAIATTNKLYSQESDISQTDLRLFVRDVNEALSALLFIKTAQDIKKSGVQIKELSVRTVAERE